MANFIGFLLHIMFHMHFTSYIKTKNYTNVQLWKQIKLFTLVRITYLGSTVFHQRAFLRCSGLTLGCQHSNSVDWQIMNTSLQLRIPTSRRQLSWGLTFWNGIHVLQSSLGRLEREKCSQAHHAVELPDAQHALLHLKQTLLPQSFSIRKKKKKGPKESQERIPTWGSNMPISSTSLTANSA